jgi:hypothetical protein
MAYAFPASSTTSVGVPLLRPSAWVRTVSSVSGARLTLAAAEGAGASSPSLSSPHYLEVLGHVDAVTVAMVGHRFEIDEAATSAAGVGELVLEATSRLNTAPATAVAGLANYRVAVRPHWTLAALFGTGAHGKFSQATTIASADQVFVWSGTGFSVFYFRGGPVPQWRNISTGAANQDQAIVPPGVGVFVKKQQSAATIAVVGEVRSNAFVRVPYVGAQVVASAFPLGSSPADWKLVAGSGLTSSTSPTFADQLLTWASSGFTSFFLRSGSPLEWRNGDASTTSFSNSNLFTPTGAALLLLKAPAVGTAPAQLVQAVPFPL